MREAERGFLLLSSHLGDQNRPVLSTFQLRILADRVRSRKAPEEERELSVKDLVSLGYGRELAQRIVNLLAEDDVLEHYLRQGRKQGCVPVSRANEGYPLILRQRLGLDSPGCLWAKGDLSILDTPAIALVGSRELREENRVFAEAVGYHAAVQGLTLVSGNARGADRTAQEACLNAGGRVISIVADELIRHPEKRNLLYLSEDGYDEMFTKARALSRNRCIHALGRMVFVAQSDLHKGGTWDGTVKNLRFGWSPVACFRDGSPAAAELEQMGAYLVGLEDIKDFAGLTELDKNYFDP